jgi:hypothetical protein
MDMGDLVADDANGYITRAANYSAQLKDDLKAKLCTKQNIGTVVKSFENKIIEIISTTR